MMDKYRENRQRAVEVAGIDMISDLERWGKWVKRKKENKFGELSSPKIIKYRSERVSRLLNIDQKNAALMVRLKTERELS